MDRILRELVGISNKVGADVRLVRGAGGNTSVKTEDRKYMYIKASGTALKDMSVRKGWRKLDVPSVLSIVNDRGLCRIDAGRRQADVAKRLLGACVDNLRRPARPSVESVMHAMLGRYVVHLHPEVVLVYLCSKNGRAALEKRFAKYEHRPVWVPYATQGFMLARKVAVAAATHRRRDGGLPSVLFLQKHGVIVTADTAQKVLRLLSDVIRICGTKLTRPKPLKGQSIDAGKIRCVKLAIRKAVLETTGRRQSVAYFADDLFVSFAGADQTRQLLSKASLTPDELVYTNGPALWVEDRRVEKIVCRCRRRMKKTGLCPAAFLVKGVGLFVAAKKNIQSIIRDVQASSLLLRYNAEKLGGVKPLTGREQSEARL